LAASGAIVLILACGLLALMLRSGNAPVVLPPQAEIQQRAVQFAQDEYAGTVTTLTMRATTQGEVNPQRCLPIRWLGQQMSLIAGDREWNHCRDDLPMWEATMQGDFRNFEGNTVHRLQVTFMPDGNVSTWSEGP
jgi:hypothetical protein